MSTKFVAAIAVVTAVTTTVAFAQGQTAPKASKADVQKLVGGIKSDKTKLAQYCEIAKLEVQSNALAQKNQNDPKLEALGKQMNDIGGKLGPDYEKIINSDLDDASAALFDDLSKSCNVGFDAPRLRQRRPRPTCRSLLAVLKAIKQSLLNSVR